MKRVHCALSVTTAFSARWSSCHTARLQHSCPRPNIAPSTTLIPTARPSPPYSLTRALPCPSRSPSAPSRAPASSSLRPPQRRFLSSRRRSASSKRSRTMRASVLSTRGRFSPMTPPSSRPPLHPRAS
ncbi:unnamed protein product [Chondrus crispus]|uniref:Uncharacterized protein n=1 Tax=Chondrus crispus TaxID=2769 RepID=R7Q8D7_CHOCR|nr:unnamed protein product [Chondrus crispus]CDF34299.1 unnamed protein product [Chondrus crispus]|eukprot:XP_005714118.1 unnamed protein product [Chondrus crispus]